MKKIIALFTVFLILIINYQNQPLFKKVDGKHIIYCNKNGSDCTFIETDNDSYQNVFKQIKKITGESVSFNNENYLYQIINDYKAKKIFSENQDNLIIEYYYSANIKNYLIINNYRVNLQVVKNQEKYTVGSPIIYGSY